MKKLKVFATVGVMALGLTGCKDDDDTNPSPSPAAPVGEMDAMPQTVFGIASGNDDFSTLAALIEDAGLKDTLNGDGPFTVFAPTNEAFAALDEATLNGLAEDPVALREVLLYHVVSGAVRSDVAITLTSAGMISGSDTAISSSDGMLFINDARVVTADIAGSNGVVHVIDKVLLPPAPEPEPKSITAIAAGNPDFSTLVSLLQSTGLDAVLTEGGPWTVFAPTNDAFAGVDEQVLAALAEDAEALRNVLLYHVVGAEVPAKVAVGLSDATMANGDDIALNVMDGGLIINGNARVIATDIMASNGVIHVIDSVLIPAADEEEAPAPSITEIAAGNPDFSTLVSLLQATGLDEVLLDGGPWTVFAPTNAAFAKIDPATLESLAADQDALKNILLYHVVPAKVPASAAVELSEAVMANSVSISLAVRDGSLYLNDNTRVIATDVMAGNGIIHVIDTVLLP